MAEHCTKGLCFNCDKSFAMNNKCKQFFFVRLEEIRETSERKEEIDDSVIPLHAITGFHSTQTM